MTAVRDREVGGGPSVQRTAGSTLAGLAFRALSAPAQPPLLARLARAALLRGAAVVGSRRRAEGVDVIVLTAEFLAVRAELRERRRRPAAARAAARSSVSDRGAEALLDDVLVALVRGFEGSRELEMSPASTGSGGAHRPVAAHPTEPSKRE